MNEKKDDISPRDGSTFKMFVCGPTVQDNIHLGHAKTYIAFDVLARWLLKKGHKVFFVLNITDIDDKIFERARKEGEPYMDIANRFFKDFLEDVEKLNIVTISRIERVSNYVKEAVQIVQALVGSGYAYELNGSYYFDTSKADHFGKLSHQNEFQLRLKQIDAAPGKRNSVDFLLWRNVTGASEGVWDCPLGPGRPGWHIEDTAIAFASFSGAYDLHGGATELIFPHHEAELAQDEAYSGEIPFVSIWMHSGLLLKDGVKMSKSLGNMVTIRDALKSYSPDLIRCYFLMHHYKESFDLNLKELEGSKDSLEMISEAAKILPKTSRTNKELKNLSQKESFREFANAMDDDLNTPKALEMLVSLSREIIKEKNNAPWRDQFKDPSPLFWHMVETLGFMPA